MGGFTPAGLTGEMVLVRELGLDDILLARNDLRKSGDILFHCIVISAKR
uniref:Uncharacterized protein n=1 Tax=Utricularia reniformis TaxID=192314 RepID=A0A1Y0AZ84_9LAMI|nr:hypothetical protein AEK19_MT0172 [Utricularia reniformis]ART30454.1 hypothetical protein AEK19_MT0172 [Utricularia reniformis]